MTVQGLSFNYRIQHNIKESIENCPQMIEEREKREEKRQLFAVFVRIAFSFYICGVPNNG